MERILTICRLSKSHQNCWMTLIFDKSSRPDKVFPHQDPDLDCSDGYSKCDHRGLEEGVVQEIGQSCSYNGKAYIGRHSLERPNFREWDKFCHSILTFPNSPLKRNPEKGLDCTYRFLVDMSRLLTKKNNQWFIWVFFNVLFQSMLLTRIQDSASLIERGPRKVRIRRMITRKSVCGPYRSERGVVQV